MTVELLLLKFKFSVLIEQFKFRLRQQTSIRSNMEATLLTILETIRLLLWILDSFRTWKWTFLTYFQTETWLLKLILKMETTLSTLVTLQYFFQNFIARINKETGKLIWAYAYFFDGFLDQLISNSFKVKNNTIWTLGAFENSVSRFSGTIKYEK